jgi:pimeloyl-ACP methyl ester carboxylesterase
MSTPRTSAAVTRYLERPGGRLAYDVHGAGPLVVCVPGMGDLRSGYRFTVPPLVAAGYRVVTVDLRGHGDSDATFDRYDDVATGEDVLALVEHLGGPAVVIGSSMGAGAAVWAAAQRPELVSGLVLTGPFVREVAVPAVLRWAMRAAMAGPWRRAVWTAYLPSLSPGRKPDDFAEHRREIAAALRRPGRSGAFGATTRTSHAPAEAALAGVRAPALVVMGAADPDFPDPQAEARWIGEQLDAEVLVVPDAGHYPHAEHPEVVTPAITAFLQRVAGA